MASAPNPATIANRQRALARRAERAIAGLPGWAFQPQPRGQRTRARLVAPDGRWLDLDWKVSRASNGECFMRPQWTGIYPKEQTAGRMFRTANGSPFDDAPPPGTQEAQDLSWALIDPRRAPVSFPLAALRLLDALQPLQPDPLRPPGYYAVRQDPDAGMWMVMATRPAMPGVTGSAYLPPAELVGFDVEADGPEEAIATAAERFSDPYAEYREADHAPR